MKIRCWAFEAARHGISTVTVRERIVTPDQLMTMGPDEQYVVTAGEAAPRHALHLRHARYWNRSDSRHLADPNPFVIRKEKARE
ncbi:MAG: hypothetical protein OXQ89_03785 [Rhodospirillaceae bacterium]|nr:hypothetical protein [Rhodospirillaceae bacterium]